ncbi:MAG: ABC transporter ATP-binding protein [Oscillospiraceae bacterium]|nr:ABC transporter ATP-binding protein [Oscillospiraceae bacterium]
MYVELKHISKSFGGFQASKDVSFSIEKGRLAALLGPSGSGKTTILRMIAGLETPDAGEIRINGELVNDVPCSQRGIGFVFQNYALFRYMSVWDNIAFGLEVQKKSRREIQERVSGLIDLVGLTGLEKRFPGQLSGGQKQRVAFARALAPNPQLLLLDEPFAAVDAKVRQELRQWLKGMITRLGITSIFVTHDQEEALEVADQIIVTNQGRVEQIGAPAEIYLKPASSFVAQFVTGVPVIEGDWRFTGFPPPPPGAKALIRPEFAEAFRPDNEKYKPLLDAAQPGIVEDVSFRGSHWEVTLRTGNASVVVRRSLQRRPVARGDTLQVVIYRLYQLAPDGSIQLLENKVLEGRYIPED